MLTPEQLKSTCVMFRKELEVQGASLGIMSVFDSMCSYLGGESRDLNRALAALEKSQQQKVELWECEDCGFSFNAIHEDDTPEGGYSCPLCAESRLEKELAEAQQTIARQREALEKIAEDLGKLPKDHPGLWMVYNLLMPELKRDSGEGAKES